MNNRHTRKRVWMMAGLCLLLALFAVNVGRLLVIDAPERSDLILVLAGETEIRPARALQLLEQGYGREVVIDVPADARIYDSTQLELAQRYVAQLSRATAVRVCPIVGRSTRDESHDAEKCLAGENPSRVLLVTSDFHTRRALSTFRHELRRTVFSVAAARDSSQFGTRWWTHRQWAKTTVDEWLRLLWWTLVDRWR